MHLVDFGEAPAPFQGPPGLETTHGDLSWNSGNITMCNTCKLDGEKRRSIAALLMGMIKTYRQRLTDSLRPGK